MEKELSAKIVDEAAQEAQGGTYHLVTGSEEPAQNLRPTAQLNRIVPRNAFANAARKQMFSPAN
jgi:hypothetical protein